MMDSTSVPSGVAVSGLMQQLKSGEISKMQLFQQIALLQAATSTGNTPTAPPAPASMAAAAMLKMAQKPQSEDTFFGASQPPSSQSIFNQTTTPAPGPVPPTQYRQQLQAPLDSQVKIGAQPLQSNSDNLASGVSHDNAQRLSVQEWMASKTRSLAPAVAASITQPSTARPESYLEQAPRPAASNTPSSMFFTLLQQPQPDAMPNQSSNIFSAPSQSQSYPSSLNQRPNNHQAPNNHQDESESQQQFLHQDIRYEDERSSVKSSRDDVQPQEYVEYDQHSFHDDTNGGPTGNGGNTVGGGVEDKFHARVTRWKSQREAIREQLKQQLLQSELDQCTFTPRVNPNSTKVITRLRKNMVSSMAHGDFPLSDAQQISILGSVSERLYQEADNYKAREELAAKLRAADEAELQRECTFKPKINKGNPITDKARPKYMTIVKKDTPIITPAALEAAAKELEECTFNPKVNGINPEMVSAQLYLQQNIYDRLSRPCGAGASNGSRSVGRSQRSLFGDDSESDMTETFAMVSPTSRRCQDDLYIRARRRRSSQAAQAQPSSCDRPRPRSAEGLAMLEENAQQFKNFLERQRFHEQSRKKKMELTTQQLIHPHRPSINKKSLMMMENGRKGDFLERITKYAIQKEHDNVKKKTVRVSDPQCTFKPSINTHSAKRQGRSVTELSRGDLLRRETAQRLLKLRMEQEEMTALTFRPQLNRVSQRVEGRLNILTSPDTYLQRIQQQRQAHTIKQRRAVQEKEMEEFAECTFKPRTIEAPAYVQRIAKSVSLNKAIKKQQEASVKSSLKPEWK